MRLTPLAASAAFDNVEGDLKQLFISICKVKTTDFSRLDFISNLY
jgi:hypothetical protein